MTPTLRDWLTTIGAALAAAVLLYALGVVLP